MGFVLGEQNKVPLRVFKPLFGLYSAAGCQ